MNGNSSTRAWLAALSAALFFFYDFVIMQMGGTLKLDWMNEFGLTATQFSLLASMFLYGNTLMLIPAGIIMDRYSIRKVMLRVIPISLIATGVFTVTHSVWVAEVARFVQGSCNAFCFLSCVLVTSQFFEEKWRGFVMGLIVTLAMLGGVVAQTPLALLVNLIGWREALLGLTCLGMVALLAFSVFVFDARRFDEIKLPTLKEEYEGFVSAFKNSKTWGYGLYISFMNLPVMVVAGLWGITYLQEVHHLAFTEACFVNSLIMIGTIVGSPVLGSLSDRFEKRQTVMAYSSVVAFFILLSVLYSHIESVYVMSVLFFLLGFATSAQVIGYPVISEKNPVELQAKAAGIASIAIMGGAALAENVTGWLLEMHHRYYGHDDLVVIFSERDFQYAFTLMLLGFVISFFICWNDIKTEFGKRLALDVN